MLEGSKLISIRKMTSKEYTREGWDEDYQEMQNPTMVMEFDSGDHIYASADPEGNHGGTLFGYNVENGNSFIILKTKE